MDTDEPKWAPGEELSFWPELKVARAQQLLSEMNMMLAVWSKGSTVKTRKVISDDQHRIDIFVDIPAPPPVSEMSLVLGDAVHNLRSALDAVVWELANLDQENPPKNPREVTFPICLTEAQWDRKVREALETVPPVALDRLRSVQPFMFERGADSALVRLHATDIRDKHKGALSCAFTVREIATELATLEYVDEDEIPDPPFTVATEEVDALANGQRVLSIHSSARFEKVSLPLTIGSEITMETDAGRVPLQPLVQVFLEQVRGTLDILYYGINAARARNERMAADAVRRISESNIAAGDMPTALPGDDLEWEATAESNPERDA